MTANSFIRSISIINIMKGGNEMTEKEKALELIGKYQKHAMLKDFGGMDFEIARGCALITCDEILNGSKVIGTKAVTRRKFWYEVRSAINAL